MSIDCRSKMEIEATKEVIRYINREKLINEVPQSEYDMSIVNE
jgi:D-3-phosphoglycerate dehydrogenase / 2-oxoglutarate reductase